MKSEEIEKQIINNMALLVQQLQQEKELTFRYDKKSNKVKIQSKKVTTLI